MPATVAAVDLGASSGRVMLARVGDGELSLAEAHRFTNEPVDLLGRLHWDVLGLYRGVLDGLRAAGRETFLDSIGIDSWAVDYGLLDGDGRLLANPVHHRDGRTDGVAERVTGEIGAERLYRTTGLQQLPFNTIYQLVTDAAEGSLESAHAMAMIPDLLSYWLTGELGQETTNASTTQLFDASARTWADELIGAAGLPRRIFGELRAPGEHAGTLVPAVAERTGLTEETAVTVVGSHDTASAVVAVPATTERFAYISCGTWSLVGLELDQPVLTEESRKANFTNELGVDGKVRYLRNVMGMWLLQESMRTWQREGMNVDLSTLLGEAAGLPKAAVIDPDDPAFLPPGDMPARMADACRATGQPVPEAPAEFVRCIVDTLAEAHRKTVQEAMTLSGRDIEVVHLVGGGSQNELLCQLTADACGLPVIAGPVEATAIGNALVQARALGAVEGDLASLRALITATWQVRRYHPR